MLVIGLTGGIGSGKSTVADMFAEFGVPIIDTDVIARQLVKPGQPALHEIVEYFGDSILTAEGELDRKRLGAITFDDVAARRALEQILHPRIRLEVEKQLAGLHADYAIVVVPLLVEKGKYSFIDRILVIDCDESQQLARTLQRDQRNKSQIRAIMKTQASRMERQAMADDIILNSGNVDQLRQAVAKQHDIYMSLCKT